MADFDLMVTWRRPDGTTEDLPATVCFRDERDDPERRGEALVAAIEHNQGDFPDDIPEGSVPISLRFTDA